MNRATPGVLTILACLACQAVMAQDEAAKRERGRQVYEYWCATCHGPGVGQFSPALPGTAALEFKYKGQVPALLAERTDMSPKFIETFVRNGVTVMPFFRKTEVSDADLDALIAYLTRNNK